MQKKFAFLALIVCVVAFAGCSTRLISFAESSVTQAVQPDGVLTALVLGWWLPGATELPDAVDHFESHARSYQGDLQDIHDGWDKHFLRYDRLDPLSE